MRVALVNNGASEPKKILELLKTDSVKVFDFSNADSINTKDFDFLVLSGSSQFPVAFYRDKLKAEIELITRSSILTLGICYGCELIAAAFGGELTDKGEQNKEKNILEIEVIEDDPIFKGLKSFAAYDAHRWIIKTVPPQFKVLAKSKHGPEIIKHKELPMYGFQFHPEKMTDQTYGDELFQILKASPLGFPVQ